MEIILKVGNTINKITESTDYSGIFCGRENKLTNCEYAFIGGGKKNCMTGSNFGAIIGGTNNIISDTNTSPTAITVCGQYNKETETSPVMKSTTITNLEAPANRAFVVGGGTDVTDRFNLFSVEAETGNVHALGTYHNGAADYAEYFESQLLEKIPVGTVVALRDGFIFPANEGCLHEEIIGVISATPNMVGNNCYT